MVDELKDNELFQGIFESSVEGILVVDQRGTIIRANPTVEKMFGYGKRELVDKKVEDLIPDTFRKSHKTHRAKYAKKPKKRTMGKNLDLWGLKKNGAQFPLEISLSPTNIEGKPVTIAFARDILEQTSVIEMDELSKDRKFNALINNLQGIVYKCNNDRNRTMEFISKGSHRITGHRPQEFLQGKIHLSHVILQKDREQVWTTIQKAIVNEKPFNLTYRIKDKKGNLKYMRELGRGIFDKDGELEALEGYITDISDLKKAEEDIKEGEKKLRNHAVKLETKVAERTTDLKDMVQKLVESNLSLEDQVQTTKAAENRAVASQEMFSAISKNFPHGAIVVVDLQFQITHLDGEELSNFRLKGSDFKGVSIDEIKLLSENQKSRIKKVIEKTLDGNQINFETRYRKNAYVVNSMPLYDSDKRIQYALFVYNNISKQKQIELETLSALAKEKELGELKSRFVDMASHEFRTPLSAILSAATLIGKQNGPGKEGKREGYVGRIKSNVKNLVVILNDFLSISKLEEGKILVHSETFDLVDFSKSILKEINPSRKKGQHIQLINEQPNMFVHLDSKMIHHILINLLTNAIKYSDEEKEVTLTISQNAKQTSLTVTDEGIGIPKAEQKYLFQRFYRAKNAMNIQGTGLGLHIVKQYTELMGGTVCFKSDPLEGTTFTVELPLNLTEK